MIFYYFIAWIAFGVVEKAAAKKCGYDSCPKSVPDKLNVHLGSFSKWFTHKYENPSHIIFKNLKFHIRMMMLDGLKLSINITMDQKIVFIGPMLAFRHRMIS